MITLIAAIDSVRGIGKQGDIPWKKTIAGRNDMAFFRRTTQESTVIMGRKTYESLGTTHLKNRINIVVSNTLENNEHIVLMGSIIPALRRAKEYGLPIFVIGGHQIYKETMLYANRILLSQIYGDHGCDTFFPNVDLNYWDRVPHLHQSEDDPIVTQYFQKKPLIL